MTNLLRHTLLLLASFALTCVLCDQRAYSQSSRIAGAITDADNGETLIGVNVIVVGSSAGAASGVDGTYEIVIGPGEYSVRVSYIGYETKLFTGIRVARGETTRLDVTLAQQILSAEDEVVVVGDRPLVDVEESSSSFSINREQISVTPVRAVQGLIANQVGVTRDPTGLYIRGGRANETGFIVDGVSAKDPLAGTGFGLDVGSNAFSEVEVTTGGVGAERGDVTSGVVSVTTQDGGNTFAGYLAHKRDNFGSLNDNSDANFNEDLYEFNFGGPIKHNKLFFFVSGQVQLEDGFTRKTSTPTQLRSSLVNGTFLLPRTGNRWNGLTKLTWQIKPGMRLQTSYQRSLIANQNTRLLQITGNESVIHPGFQYLFVDQPDEANTFAHDTNIMYLKWSHVLNERSFYEVQASRLFTKMRADANGRPWRPQNVDTELNPESIVDYPAEFFLGENGLPPNEDVVFVLPGPGFINNGGIATRFHDHFAEELTLRATYTRFSTSKNFRLNTGFEWKFNDYQWIDIIRPWVGAPIITASGDTTRSNRLGQSSDIWRVKPWRGGFFGTGQMRYRGLIANLGLRLEYWAPGKYVDDLVKDPAAPILDSIRKDYMDQSIGLIGRRFKFRLLPKIRVSFPIKENQVLFFNYGHSTQLPHPTFVYTGLDPFYQDRSFFADLGNPNLNPEVDISYELGFRNQITANDVFSITAFWRDKFDFITVENVRIPDPTGREVTRAFRVNGDFARIRGLELSYLKRIGRWFQGQFAGSFSRAVGLSSTNNDALAQFLQRGDADNTFETPLAWDRPIDLKANFTFSRADSPLLGVPGLSHFRLYLSSTYRSGRRYTPVIFRGFSQNPFTGENDWRPIYETDTDPAKRYAEIGKQWWWFDLSFQRDVNLFGNTLVFDVEVTNLFNQLNSEIVNPVTGETYPNVDPETTDFVSLRGDRSYDLPNGIRDPRYEDPTTSGLPPFNPARFLPQRHITLGLSYRF
ncbi:MAG: carboxypeptidase-like regulatory domain-containing protein [Rhodothermales bacterium]